MKDKERFQIQMVNNLDDDSISVEILLDDLLIAELSKDGSNIIALLFPPPRRSVDAHTLLEALKDAVEDAENLPT